MKCREAISLDKARMLGFTGISLMRSMNSSDENTTYALSTIPGHHHHRAQIQRSSAEPDIRANLCVEQWVRSEMGHEGDVLS